MSWLADLIPWWLWALGIAGGLAATFPLWAPLWGPLPQPARLVLAAIAAATLAHLAGRRVGARTALTQAREQEAADADRILEQARRARAGADARHADGGLRDDDGWRRGD